MAPCSPAPAFKALVPRVFSAKAPALPSQCSTQGGVHQPNAWTHVRAKASVRARAGVRIGKVQG